MNTDRWKNKSKKGFATFDHKEKEDRRTIRRHKSKIQRDLHTTDIDDLEDLDIDTFEKI